MATTAKERLLLDVIQKYDSYEKCCEKLGIEIDYFEDLPKHEAAYKMLCIIAKAFNGGQGSYEYYIPKFDFEVKAGMLISSCSHADDFYHDYKIYTWYYNGRVDITVSGPKSIAYVYAELAKKSGNMFPELWFNFLTGQE